MHDDDAAVPRPSVWSRVRAQLIGLPPHLLWLRIDLPAGERWILRAQRLMLSWTALAVVFLVVLKSGRLAGWTPPDGFMGAGVLLLVVALGSSVAIAAVVGAMGAWQLLRGGARTWRLGTLTLVCLAIVAGAVYLVASVMAFAR